MNRLENLFHFPEGRERPHATFFSSDFSKNVFTTRRIAAQTTQESATLKEGQGLKGGKPKSKMRKTAGAFSLVC
jgi:hypothetical protein